MMLKDLKSKIKRAALRFLFIPGRFWRKSFVLPKQIKQIKEKISLQKTNSIGGEDLKENISIVSSFRITTPQRQAILDTSFYYSLKDLKAPLRFQVADASTESFALENKKILQRFSNLNLEYQNKKAGLNSAYCNLLERAKEPYFVMLFEDLPMVGLNENFLSACCGLLRDFSGLVDIIFPEAMGKFEVDDTNKTIFYDTESCGLKFHPQNVIGIVKYGVYQFAVIKNYHYGFFFNDLIASRAQYLKRLKWYMKRVAFDDPHLVELAASVGIGPLFEFMAIPVEVFNFDMDYFHTDLSIRKPLVETERLHKALMSGYSLKEKRIQ